jgi:hypothetical protein
MTATETKKRGPRPSPENALRPRDVCRRLGISANLFYKMKNDGKIKTISLGARTVFVPISEVLRLEGRLPETDGQGAA